MAFTQSQIDALETALAQGTLEVQYADKKIKYRDLDEMERILNKMKSEVAGTPRSVGGVRLYARHSKGLK